MPEQINGAQSLAIEHAFGPVQVLAGPGSGKTFLTIRRIRHLICHHGISPNQILVITFTKAAAKEMEQRFQLLTKEAYREVTFGTFHAVFYRILKHSNYIKDNFRLANTGDKIRYLTHILKTYGINNIDNELVEELLGKISLQKNGINQITWEKTEHFSEIMREYEMLMREENKLDFDDMILLCDKMFDENKNILSFWQHRFSHILVDEFQDIGNLQYRIVKRLAQPENNLFVVGDDDQSIYGFRGAGPDIMKQFSTDYPQAKKLTLNTNYRCTENILEAALVVISENRNRFVKKLMAVKGKGEEVVVASFDTREKEFEYMIKRFREIPSGELAQTAVIFRSNAQAAALAAALLKEKIPFHIKHRVNNIFEQDMAKDILAYLQFANDCCRSREKTGKRKDFLRIMNKPCRYIQRCALTEEEVSEKRLTDYYNEKIYMQENIKGLFRDLEKIASLRPYLAINYIRKVIGYDKHIQDAAEKLDEIQNTAMGYKRLEDWLDFIYDYSQSMNQINAGDEREHEGNGKPTVKLLTMHASKGLQYKRVFLPDINKSMIPGKKAVNLQLVEEERRMFYVAMTRAENALEILYYGQPSPFINHLIRRRN